MNKNVTLLDAKGIIRNELSRNPGFYGLLSENGVTFFDNVKRKMINVGRKTVTVDPQK
jgi:hypothetical protein